MSYWMYVDLAFLLFLVVSPFFLNFVVRFLDPAFLVSDAYLARILD